MSDSLSDDSDAESLSDELDAELDASEEELLPLEEETVDELGETLLENEFDDFDGDDEPELMELTDRLLEFDSLDEELADELLLLDELLGDEDDDLDDDEALDEELSDDDDELDELLPSQQRHPMVR